MAKNEGIDYVINNETYCSSYDVYRRGLLEQQKLWLSEKVIPVLSARLNKPCLRVLAVGTGEGDVDVVLLSGLLEQFQKAGTNCEIHYVVVERNSNFVERFKKRVKGSAFDTVKFTWLNTTLEEVVSKSEVSLGTFHLIHFFHSLYYMDEEKVLKDCMENYLEAGGCILAVVQTEGGLYTKNCRKFEGKIQDCFNGFNIISDETLRSLADKNGWECKTEIGKRTLDLTLILSEKLHTQDGSELFDFFFHSKDLVKHLKEDQLKEILDFFRSNCAVVDGKFYSDGSEGIVFLFKN